MNALNRKVQRIRVRRESDVFAFPLWAWVMLIAIIEAVAWYGFPKAMKPGLDPAIVCQARYNAILCMSAGVIYLAPILYLFEKWNRCDVRRARAARLKQIREHRGRRAFPVVPTQQQK